MRTVPKSLDESNYDVWSQTVVVNTMSPELSAKSVLEYFNTVFAE